MPAALSDEDGTSKDKQHTPWDEEQPAYLYMYVHVQFTVSSLQ